MEDKFFEGVLENPGFETLVLPHEEKRRKDPLKFDWREEERYEPLFKELLFTSKYLVPRLFIDGRYGHIFSRNPVNGVAQMVAFTSTSSFETFLQKSAEARKDFVQDPWDKTNYSWPDADNTKVILTDFDGLMELLRDPNIPPDEIAIDPGTCNIFYTEAEMEQLCAEKNGISN